MRVIFFDLDGTLYQTERIAVPAMQQTFDWLHRENVSSQPTPTPAEIKSMFGLTGREFWLRLLPDADADVRQLADEQLLKYELALIKQGKGRFYPGVVKGLQRLKAAGWQLCIVSNGLSDYIHGVLDSAELRTLFMEIYALGDQPGVSKTEAVRQCIEQYAIQQGVMVGDRASDVVAGRANQLLTLGCRYDSFPAFADEGELAGADAVLTEFAELFERIEV
jgi:phosphoglycolate phosphatase